MTKLEQTIATADAYSRVRDLLMIEELVLADMSLRQPEASAAFLAQAARVDSLQRVEAYFSADLAGPSSGEGARA